MKKLSIIIISLLFAQQAYGLDKELETLAKSLIKLAEDLGGEEAPPPPIPVGEESGPVYALATAEEKEKFTRPLPPSPITGEVPPLPSPLTGPKTYPQELPPPPPVLGTTTKPSASEQELLERLKRYSGQRGDFDFSRLMSNLKEAKNLKTISSDTIKPYEILLFETTIGYIFSILQESRWRDLHWYLEGLSTYGADPKVVAKFKPEIEDMFNRQFESLLNEDNQTDYVEMMKAIQGLVGPEIIDEARNKLFEKIKPKLAETLAKSDWDESWLREYLRYLDDLKKAGVPEVNLTYYKEQIGLKALSTLEKISKTTEWNKDDISFYYACFKALKDLGKLPKESSTYQQQLISLLLPELDTAFSQVKTWDDNSIGKISRSVNMLIEVGAPPVQLKKYQDTLLSNIRKVLDEIVNEKDISQLIYPDTRWRTARAYLMRLEKSGASQEDVSKYNDLYVKYIKRRLDALLEEAKKAAGKLTERKIGFANQLRNELEELNIFKNEIASYRQQIADLRLP